MSANARTVAASTTDPVRQARIELAALHRLYVKYGLTDLIFTHITMRCPDNPNHYFIKPDMLLMHEVTASNLLRVDMDGNLIEGDAEPNTAGHLIHTAVFKARPDLNCLTHTHSRAGIAVSAMQCGLLPLSQHAGLVLPAITYHDYQDVTEAEDECEMLARDMGQNFYIMIMRNHGLLATGRNAAEAFYNLYYTEMACKAQVDILASGQPYTELSDEIVNGLYKDSIDKDGGVSGSATRAWQPLMRWLDDTDPSYRD